MSGPGPGLVVVGSRNPLGEITLEIEHSVARTALDCANSAAADLARSITLTRIGVMRDSPFSEPTMSIVFGVKRSRLAGSRVAMR